MADERDRSTPMGESYPTLATLIRERDPLIERQGYWCSCGHYVITEQPSIEPVKCPECTGPQESPLVRKEWMP